MISYRIDCSGTRTHLFEIELTVPEPAAGQRFSLPVWIPGSYLVREFARHLSSATAAQGGRPVPLRQLDKASWQATCHGQASLVVRYRVYAFDTSVRAAFLGAARGFFNGTGVCLRVEGREHEPHAIAVTGLPSGWDVATAFDLDRRSAHEFVAPARRVADTPVELGAFGAAVEVAGVPHEFVVAGALPDFDGESSSPTRSSLCAAEVAFWHGKGSRVWALRVPAHRPRRRPRAASSTPRARRSSQRFATCRGGASTRRRVAAAVRVSTTAAATPVATPSRQAPPPPTAATATSACSA